MRPKDQFLRIKAAIVVTAYLFLCGLGLSAIHQLNIKGYFVLLLSGVVPAAVWMRRTGFSANPGKAAGKFAWRRAHIFPAIFLLYCALSFVGGLLYPPNNYDALTYRIPRVLHWLTAGQWGWIETTEARMNYSAMGFEWLMTPFFALFKSDRLLFLINFCFYLLFPGVIYAAFTRLGVSKRMAWIWMWLLPTAYGFVLSAASIGNDASAAFFMLAAIAFALRSRESERISDLWFSMLSAALVTGMKASNLPLLLPWAIAISPTIRIFRQKLAATGLVVLVCAGVSFLPLAWLNHKHTGDWAGDPTNQSKMKLSSPAFGLLGNAMQLTAANVLPPVAPFAKAWNQKTEAFLRTPRMQPLMMHFPRLSVSWNELQQEEAAALGLGLCSLLVLTAIGGARGKNGAATASVQKKLGAWIVFGAWGAMLAYMAKFGSEASPRIALPYYPLLAAGFLLLPGACHLARRSWWKCCAAIAALSALPSLILTPSRPLLPVPRLCEMAPKSLQDSPLLARTRTAYATYQARSDVFAPLRQHLDATEKTIAFLGFDDCETSLWRPFGSRQVIDFTPNNSNEIIRQSLTLVTRREAVKEFCGQPLEQWIAVNGGRIVRKETVTSKVSVGPQDWFIIRFDGKSR